MFCVKSDINSVSELDKELDKLQNIEERTLRLLCRAMLSCTIKLTETFADCFCARKLRLWQNWFIVRKDVFLRSTVVTNGLLIIWSACQLVSRVLQICFYVDKNLANRSTSCHTVDVIQEAWLAAMIIFWSYMKVVL